MMQRALKEAGIDRAAASMALFERGPRKAPLIGKVVGVGLVDEITDRTWVVVDAVDGRVHYAELGRLDVGDVPARGMLVAGLTVTAAMTVGMIVTIGCRRVCARPYRGAPCQDRKLEASGRAYA